MNVVAIIQARTGSTRLPNKIFLKIENEFLLTHVVNRVKHSVEINNIVIATTKSLSDNRIEKFCIEKQIDCFRGDEHNVLQRYYKAALKYKADIVVRITADDPFKDYRLIDKAVVILKNNKYDFVCNNLPVSFPEGLDVEVMTIDSLRMSFLNATTDFEKEHVTQHIHKNPKKFSVFNIKNNIDLSHYRWTIDTESDFIFVKEVYKKMYNKNKIFLTEEILELLAKYPNLISINNEVKRSNLYNNKIRK